jgi:hypothetical protein
MTVNELGHQLYQGAANMLHAIGNIELNDVGRRISDIGRSDIFGWLLLSGIVGMFIYWPFAAVRGWRLEQEAKEAQKKLAQLGAADFEKLRADLRDVFRERSLAETTGFPGTWGVGVLVISADSHQPLRASPSAANHGSKPP